MNAGSVCIVLLRLSAKIPQGGKSDFHLQNKIIS